MKVLVRVLFILALFYASGQVAKSDEAAVANCPKEMLVEPPATEWKTEDMLKIPSMNERCRVLFSSNHCAVSVTKTDEGKYDIECGIP